MAPLAIKSDGQLQDTSIEAAKKAVNRYLEAVKNRKETIDFPSSIMRTLGTDLGNLFDTQYAVTQFLRAVSIPKVAEVLQEAMCKAHYQDLIQFMTGSHIFLEELQKPELKCQMELEQWWNEDPEDRPDLIQKWNDLAEEQEAVNKLRKRRSSSTPITA